MAGIDLVLGGMRDLRSGVRGLGDDITQAQEIKAQRENEGLKRQKAEEIANVRLGLSDDLDVINEKIVDPSYTQEQFAQDIGPISKKAIEIGDMSVLSGLEDARQVFQDRSKLKVAERQNESAAEREKRVASQRDQDIAFKSREEIRTIKDRHRKASEDTVTRGNAFRQIQTVAEGEPSAAGDLSLIFSYMKVLDPPSTVREGEQALAENARGVPDSIRNMYNKVVAGERLTPEQRKDFQNQAENIYRSALTKQQSVDDEALAELREAVGGDEKAFNEARKKAISRTAKDELADLDKAKKERDAKAQDESAKNATNISGETVPKLKVFGRAAGEKLYELNKGPVDAAIKAAEAREGRTYTPSEKNQIISEWALKQGIKIDPNLP